MLAGRRDRCADRGADCGADRYGVPTHDTPQGLTTPTTVADDQDDRRLKTHHKTGLR